MCIRDRLQVAPGENGPQTGGWKGSTLDYRKIQSVELDRHYLEYMTSDMYRAVVDGVCPPGEGVSVFRAMFFNKPGRAAQEANGGSDRRRPPATSLYTRAMAAHCTEGALGRC